MCLCFKWVRAEVISKECGECILYESEGFEDRKSCCVLVEYGKNNQHESWAYFGIVVSEDEWSMPVNSRMCGCFPGSDHGACVPPCASQRDCPLPHAVYGQAHLLKHGVNPQDIAQIHLEFVNRKTLLSNL